MKNSKKSVKMLLVKSVGSLLIALPLATSAGGSDYSSPKQSAERGTAPATPSASAPVVAAGNGGAYNGPTFTTGAIPVSAERGIKEKNLLPCRLEFIKDLAKDQDFELLINFNYNKLETFIKKKNPNFKILTTQILE